jgi:hypothetical protein
MTTNVVFGTKTIADSYREDSATERTGQTWSVSSMGKPQ